MRVADKRGEFGKFVRHGAAAEGVECVEYDVAIGAGGGADDRSGGGRRARLGKGVELQADAKAVLRGELAAGGERVDRGSLVGDMDVRRSSCRAKRSADFETFAKDAEVDARGERKDFQIVQRDAGVGHNAGDIFNHSARHL